MQSSMPFFPDEASSIAPHVDALFTFILLTCLFFAVMVTLFAIYAAFRYRRTSPNEVGDDVEGNMLLEIGWTAIPLVTLMKRSGNSPAKSENTCLRIRSECSCATPLTR